MLSPASGLSRAEITGTGDPAANQARAALAPDPNSKTASTAAEDTDALERAERERGRKYAVSFWDHLTADVKAEQATSPLVAYCFMTGYLDAISFSAIFVWCGFQTGNTVQLSIALCRLFEGSRDLTFQKADQQALCSLLSFDAGAFLGRIGDRVGTHKRLWLIAGTFLQALFTMAAALVFWKAGQPSIANGRDDPAWTDARTFVGLAFMSASLGLQGIIGKRLNTQLSTTVVLTTVWVELMTDPRLFRLRHRVATRDHRIIGIFALFLGGFTGRSILAQIGTAGTLGIGVGFRFFTALSWLFVPSKS